MASRAKRRASGEREGAPDTGVQKVHRDTGRTRISRVADLYGAGEKGTKLQGRFDTERVHAWFQDRHKSSGTRLDEQGFYHYEDKETGREHSWKVPYGVRAALHTRLTHSQIANRYPWYVTWRSPKNRMRYRKYFGSLMQAVHFIATRAQYVDPHACVVSRHGYDIPAKLRGKIPAPWKWCPMCMTARRYRAVAPEQTFFGQVKKSSEKGGYIWVDVRLRLLHCQVCGCTNRDSKYRRSNQPWELRKFKRGVTRAKRRR